MDVEKQTSKGKRNDTSEQTNNTKSAFAKQERQIVSS